MQNFKVRLRGLVDTRPWWQRLFSKSPYEFETQGFTGGCVVEMYQFDEGGWSEAPLTIEGYAGTELTTTVSYGKSARLKRKTKR